MSWNPISTSSPIFVSRNDRRSVIVELWSIVLIVLAMTSWSLSAQVLSTKASDEPITLDLDNSVTKRLVAIEDFIAEKQWDVVASMLRQTQAEKPDKLVSIGPGWYVSVARYCQCRAALLPLAGLTAYRQQVNPSAKK